jgi:hypothetical protein
MKSFRTFWIACWALAVAVSLPTMVRAQEHSAVVLAGPQLTRVVPSSFYFQGLSAPTQMRNAVAARWGTNRYVIAGLVDTSGYAADVRAKYEGFLITDSLVSINGSDLGTGAYGFGFTDNGKLNILDLAGKELASITTVKDRSLKRPRPLMMMQTDKGVRLYSGRDYVEIAIK